MDMAEKRPETSAEILSRSQRVDGSVLRQKSRRKNYSVDLPGHMAECDANYRRLLRLFPGLRDSSDHTFTLALPEHHTQVIFKVLERGPYTTLLEIDLGGPQRDAAAGGSEWLSRIAAPRLSVRIYHDAQSAEVVS